MAPVLLLHEQGPPRPCPRMIIGIAKANENVMILENPAADEAIWMKKKHATYFFLHYTLFLLFLLAWIMISNQNCAQDDWAGKDDGICNLHLMIYDLRFTIYDLLFTPVTQSRRLLANPRPGLLA